MQLEIVLHPIEMMKSFTKIFVLLILFVASLFAQTTEEPITWTLSTDAKSVTANSVFEAKLTAKLGAGWYLYSTTQPPGGPNATKIEIKEPFKLTDKIKADPPKKKFDNNFRMETEFYKEKAEFGLPIQAGSDVKELVVAVTFQLCNDEVCLPPDTVELKASFAANNETPAPVKTVVPPSKTVDLAVGDVVPEFAFTDFEGKPRKFSEFSGKIVLIDFWATWCSPCLKDIPKLKVFYDKYKAQGFEIIGLQSESIGEDEMPDAVTAKESFDRAKQIVKTRNANWTQANDETATPLAKKMFDVKALPTKILIDKNGKIIAKIGEKDDLEKILSDLLAKQ